MYTFIYKLFFKKVVKSVKVLGKHAKHRLTLHYREKVLGKKQEFCLFFRENNGGDYAIFLYKNLTYRDIYMPQRKKIVRTQNDLTNKQKKYIDILVSSWGNITKVDALIQAGYKSKNKDAAMVLASKLTNPHLNPHVCRYLEYKLSKETEKYEKDKLRRYKTFERLRDGAEQKGQYTGAIAAEFRSGQLAGTIC